MQILLTVRRMCRLLVGLAVFGVGVAMIVRGNNGLPGWDVLHQGLENHTPLTIGRANMAVGAVLLILLVALREPIGVGTLCNVLVVGMSVDITLALLDEPTAMVGRVALTLLGPIVIAIGSGIYIACRLGPGPRDGLMTAFQRRGIAVWKGRFAVEATALVIGVFLGGTIGWGTVWFLVSIGPAVQFMLAHIPAPSYLDDSDAVTGWARA